MTKEEYNKEPVYFCSQCLSLKVVDIDDTDLAYCESCGNTDILEATIEEWEKLYEEKYGIKFINKK